MGKCKRIMIYIVYIAAIIAISITGDKFNNYLFLLHSTYYKSIYFWFLPIYPILIGCLMALPQFLGNAGKTGAWNFDWIKFLVVGIPSLYIAFTYIIYFSQIGDILPVIHSPQLYIIGGILFGSVLLTSFHKQSF